MRGILGTLLVLCVGFVGGALLGDAVASRNSSGTFSLPAGNPVVSGTTISPTWANNTMSDLGTEMTDSLSRSGKGPMLAPLKLTNGTAAAPAICFDSDADNGLYRIGANNPAIAAGGVMAQEWTSTASNFPGYVSLDGGGGSLKLLPGSQDHAFMAIYADTAAPTTRSGYVGFPAAGGTVLTIGNEFTNGSIQLSPNGSGTVATDKNMRFSGSNPTSTTGFTSAVTPMNIVKAWVKVQSGASPTALAGFNVAAVSCSSNEVLVTIADDMSSTAYAIIGMSGSSGKIVQGGAYTGGQFGLNLFNDDGTQIDLCANTHTISALVLGAQ